MEELEQNIQQTEQAQLTKQERRKLNKQRKRKEQQGEQRKQNIKSILVYAVIILVVGGGIWGFMKLLSSRPGLPPISGANHSESVPPAHITNQPIPDRIQRHMLEHADGSGPPGIIIQYNCEDFDCEPDLVQKLTDLIDQYPQNVYLAPNNYDGKIILTKQSRREILDSFDEQFIKDFIR